MLPHFHFDHDDFNYLLQEEISKEMHFSGALRYDYFRLAGYHHSSPPD